MNQFKEHIILRLVAVFLIATLLSPTAVKLAHSFVDHTHDICTTDRTEHLHEMDFECEFDKFKVSKEYTYSTYYSVSAIQKNRIEPIISQYNFISDFQNPRSTLRGPPTIV